MIMTRNAIYYDVGRPGLPTPSGILQDHLREPWLPQDRNQMRAGGSESLLNSVSDIIADQVSERLRKERRVSRHHLQTQDQSNINQNFKLCEKIICNFINKQS